MVNLKKDRKLIILADDDEDLAFLLGAQLQQAGYNVHTCMGGKNLIDDVLQLQPGLLLLDIAMLDVDGGELCRQIKNDARISHTKIVLMSGNHDIVSHAAGCGADGYIAKPLSLSSLKAEVAKYIN